MKLFFACSVVSTGRQRVSTRARQSSKSIVIYFAGSPHQQLHLFQDSSRSRPTGRCFSDLQQAHVAETGCYDPTRQRPTLTSLSRYEEQADSTRYKDRRNARQSMPAKHGDDCYRGTEVRHRCRHGEYPTTSPTRQKLADSCTEIDNILHLLVWRSKLC